SPVYRADNTKLVVTSGAIDDHLFADLNQDHEFLSETEAALHGRPDGEITGFGENTVVNLRYIFADGGNSILIGSAQGGRYPHFSNDPNRVYLTTPQGLTSVRLDGQDRRTILKVTGTGAPPNPAPASMIKISPDGAQAFCEVQGKHYLVTIPKAGKETVNVSVVGGTPAVPVKKMSAEGGEYIAWSRDGKSVTWSWGAKFYRQSVNQSGEAGADKSESFDIVVEAPRDKPKGVVALTGARVITMKGDEVIEKGDIIITDNRITE